MFRVRFGRAEKVRGVLESTFRVLQDVQCVPRALWDCESKYESNESRHNANADDKSPQPIDSSKTLQVGRLARSYIILDPGLVRFYCSKRQDIGE